MPEFVEEEKLLISFSQQSMKVWTLPVRCMKATRVRQHKTLAGVIVFNSCVKLLAEAVLYRIGRRRGLTSCLQLHKEVSCRIKPSFLKVLK